MKLDYRTVVGNCLNIGLLSAIWVGLVGNCLAVPMIAIEIMRMKGSWGGTAVCMAVTSVASVVCILELRRRVVKSHDSCQLATLEDKSER
jgi:hypothetical protein